MLRNLALAAVVVIVSSSQASAAPIYQMTGGTQTSGQEFTYGFDFTPVQDITVDALGFWDFGADGLSDGHRVGIWTLQGALLASTTVTTANSVLSGPVATGGQYRYTAIAGLNLLTGVTYRLGAAIEDAPDIWLFGGINSAASPTLATVSPNGFFTSGNFLFPNQTIGNTYNAGNLLALPTVTAVPEPTSLLLFGTGAAALAAKARRRKKQQVQ